MNEEEFPYYYPDEMMDVSWKIKNIAGPYKKPYKNCDHKTSPYIWKNVILSIFKKNGVGLTTESNKMIEYLLDCFTIFIVGDNNQFNCSMKKDKDRKILFDIKKWKNLCNDAGLTQQGQAKEMLQYLIDESLKFYNSLI